MALLHDRMQLIALYCHSAGNVLLCLRIQLRRKPRAKGPPIVHSTIAQVASRNNGSGKIGLLDPTDAVKATCDIRSLVHSKSAPDDTAKVLSAPDLAPSGHREADH